MKKFDAIIIGAGQAGPSLAGRLTGAGMKVALVERKLFGGTCVNTGCTPTKTLIASAYAAHLARRAADFGVLLEGPVRVDMRRVKARADDARDQPTNPTPARGPDCRPGEGPHHDSRAELNRHRAARRGGELVCDQLDERQRRQYPARPDVAEKGEPCSAQVEAAEVGRPSDRRRGDQGAQPRGHTDEKREQVDRHVVTILSAKRAAARPYGVAPLAERERESLRARFEKFNLEPPGLDGLRLSY